MSLPFCAVAGLLFVMVAFPGTTHLFLGVKRQIRIVRKLHPSKHKKRTTMAASEMLLTGTDKAMTP